VIASSLAAATEAGNGGGYLVIVVGFVILAVGYWISLVIHPYAKCRTCKGRARHRGAIYTYAFRSCRTCKGTGRRLRLGARMFPVNRGS
jgi:hypothetical protein